MVPAESGSGFEFASALRPNFAVRLAFIADRFTIGDVFLFAA